MKLRRYYTDCGNAYTENTVALAESMIDSYSSPFLKAISDTIVFYSGSVANTTLVLPTDQAAKNPYDNALTGCYATITDNAGKSATARITAYDNATRTATMESIESAGLNLVEGVVVKIWQVGLYPRLIDTQIIDKNGVQYMVKSIPQAVAQATMLQADYLKDAGEDIVNSMSQNLKSERTGSYSFELKGGANTSITFSAEAMKVLKAAGLAGSFMAVG